MDPHFETFTYQGHLVQANVLSAVATGCVYCEKSSTFPSKVFVSTQAGRKANSARIKNSNGRIWSLRVFDGYAFPEGDVVPIFAVPDTVKDISACTALERYKKCLVKDGPGVTFQLTKSSDNTCAMPWRTFEGKPWRILYGLNGPHPARGMSTHWFITKESFLIENDPAEFEKYGAPKKAAPSILPPPLPSVATVKTDVDEMDADGDIEMEGTEDPQAPAPGQVRVPRAFGLPQLDPQLVREQHFGRVGLVGHDPSQQGLHLHQHHLHQQQHDFSHPPHLLSQHPSVPLSDGQQSFSPPPAELPGMYGTTTTTTFAPDSPSFHGGFGRHSEQYPVDGAGRFSPDAMVDPTVYADAAPFTQQDLSMSLSPSSMMMQHPPPPGGHYFMPVDQGQGQYADGQYADAQYADAQYADAQYADAQFEGDMPFDAYQHQAFGDDTDMDIFHGSLHDDRSF